MTVEATNILRDDKGEVYVMCAGFCGTRLYAPGRKWHLDGCGADDEEVAALDAMLAADKIKAAGEDGADLNVEPDPEDADVSVECPFCKQAITKPGSGEHTFDCAAEMADLDELNRRIIKKLDALAKGARTFTCPVCDDVFDDKADLHAHLEEKGHAAEFHAAHDAEVAPAEIPLEVDGKKAKLKRTPPAPDYSSLWRDPEVDLDWVFELQAKIDSGEIVMGGIEAGKPCAGKITVQPQDEPAVEIACPHKPAMRTIQKNECSLEHTHTKTVDQECAIHFIIAHGGNKPVAGPGPLFGDQG